MSYAKRSKLRLLPKGELLDAFGYEVCELESSIVILFCEQSQRGRVTVAYKDHVSEMVDISDEERDLFFKEVNQVAQVLHKLYQPDKVNHGAYGDGGSHLHFHLVPKYKKRIRMGHAIRHEP